MAVHTYVPAFPRVILGMVNIPSDMILTMFDGVMMFIVAAGLLSTEQFREALFPTMILRVSTVLLNSGASENVNDEENEGYIRKGKEIEKDKRSSKSYTHQQCFLFIPHTGCSDYRISRITMRLAFKCSDYELKLRLEFITCNIFHARMPTMTDMVFLL